MRNLLQQYSRTAGMVGAAVLLAGLIRYSIQEVWGQVNLGLVIAGSVLLLLSLLLNLDVARTSLEGRSGKGTANLSGLLLAVLAILVAVNYLGYRYHKRFDLTSEGLFTLSDQTRKILTGLETDISILHFDKSDDQQLSDQMREFKSLSRRISFQRIDPQEKPDLARKYGVQRMGETLVIAGERIERPSASTEQDLVNAVMKVTRDQLKSICFLTGHGEKDLAGADPEGYQSMEKALQRENYETRSISLVAENSVPADCSVLVVAGPKKALFSQEEKMVEVYLREGGKVLLMIDPETDPGVTALLKDWNLQLRNDTVVDASGMGRLFGTGPAVPMVSEYATHPITRDMTRTATFFPLARSIGKVDESNNDQLIVELLRTSQQSWGETELVGGEARFDDGKDEKGPVTIGVAATRAAGEKEARLVIIGDSDFADNNYARLAGNGDLFLNTVNWLAQEEDLISIRPKSPTNRTVTMTSSEQRSFFLFIVFLMPLAVIVSGAYVWWKRR
jgi:ABC-type uncharacterized transport system involved in gliding motility auxiliary subunit